MQLPFKEFIFRYFCLMKNPSRPPGRQTRNSCKASQPAGKNRRWILRILWMLLLPAMTQCVYSPDTGKRQPSSTIRSQKNIPFRILYYNVENLFDTRDDSLTDDGEFLPEGSYHWSSTRYQHKIRQIYKVIAATGGKEPPAILGLSEIENREVLEDLLRKTPLNHFGYRIVHRDSPDPRGIDVAFLYRETRFKPFREHYIPLREPDGYTVKTREMILMSGVLPNRDTLHIGICHWPSRINGARSERLRQRAALLMRHTLDSLLQGQNNALVIIGGDMNDTPESKSLTQSLQAFPSSLAESAPPKDQPFLVNLSRKDPSGTGTYSYQNRWEVIDQIVVSRPLMQKSGRTGIHPNGFQIFQAEFLMEYSENAMQTRPFRTYRGPAYLGGYSDHLPVYVDLVLQKKSGLE